MESLTDKLLTQHKTSAPLRLPFTRGNPYAKIVIVGEAPGADEDAAFREGAKDTAFVGAAGNIGDRILRDAGIPQESVYFTNVVKRRPPDNKIKAVPYEEIQQSIELLHKEISRLPECTLLVPVGNLALYALTEINTCKLDKTRKWITQLSGISNFRGSILQSVPLNSSGLSKKVIPTFHFAYVGRVWKTRPTVVADFKRIKDDAEFPDLRHPHPEHIIRPTLSQILEYCDYLLTQRALITDIENFPLCVGLSHSKSTAMCVPFQEADGSSIWSVEDEAKIHRAINNLFCKHRNHVGHYYYHDAYCYHHLGWLEGLTSRFTGLGHDTFSAHVCMFGELPHSLQYLTSIYTREPYYKDEGRKWKPSDPVEQVWRYNCKDITTTAECAECLEGELHELNLYDLYQTYYIKLFPHLLQSMIRGMRVDEVKRAVARREHLKLIIEAQEKLHQQVGREYVQLPRGVETPKEWNNVEGYLNVKSNPQVHLALKDLGINVKSTQEKYLRKEAARNDEARPIIKSILSVRSFRDVHARYLVPRLGHDGRFHYTLKAATETGRLSSSKDPFGYGNNCQNIPDGICRSYFVPDPGKVMIYADLAQAEARMVAYLAKCPKMIEEFERADEAAAAKVICSCGSGKLFSKCCGDVHRLSAANVFSRPVHTITDDLRSMGKRVKHASNYMMGAYTFSLTSGLPVGLCKKLLRQYFIIYPEVLDWHESIHQRIIKTRRLTNPFGRTRIFFGHPYSDDTLREAVAFIPQSSIPDIVNLAYMQAQEDGMQVLMQAHDALLIQVYLEELREACKYLQEIFNIPVPIDKLTSIKIPLDINVGDSWSEDDLMPLEDYLERAA